MMKSLLIVFDSFFLLSLKMLFFPFLVHSDGILKYSCLAHMQQHLQAFRRCQARTKSRRSDTISQSK